MEALPDASPQDLSQQQISALRDWLLTDLFAFAWFIMDYRDLTGPLHGRIAQLISRWGSPGFERVMVQIPREFFKTSLCTRANALWQITRHPHLPVAIFNERIDNASKWLRSIRDVVRSSILYQVIFRELLPPGVARGDNRSMPRWWKWSDTELDFEGKGTGTPEASITALGIGAAAAGGHWPKIIKDDLISEDAAGSVSVMESAKEWFDKSLYLERPALKGWDFVVCTPWSYDDLYTYILRKYNYKLYRRAALEDLQGNPSLDGESTFPEKLSTKDLIAQYERDPYGFSAQMMCQPRPGRDISFDPDWLRHGSIIYNELGHPHAFAIDREHYDPAVHLVPDPTERAPRVVPLSSMSIVLLVDPAPSEESDRKRERSSRNGLLVEGIDPWGRRFLLEAWASRVDPYDVIRKMLLLCEKWGTNRIVIEEVNFSKLYRHWIREEASQQGRWVSVTPVKPDRRSKDTRITSKINPARRGFIYLNTSETAQFQRELREYPYGSTRDLLDAWAYSDDILSRPESPSETELRYYDEETTSWGRDRVTGY